MLRNDLPPRMTWFTHRQRQPLKPVFYRQRASLIAPSLFRAPDGKGFARHEVVLDEVI